MNDDADQMLAAARGFFHTGKFADAERELQKLIALAPGLADAWFMLGMTHRSLARQQAAMDACHEAVRLDPSHTAAHNLLGILLAEMGRCAEAIEEFNRALALNPKNADTHFNLGLALLREQRVTEAVEAWRLAIELRPTHVGAQAMLQQHAPAAPVMPAMPESLVGADVPLIHRQENNAQGQLEIARQAFERGDFAAAEAACREALRGNTEDPKAIHDLGVVLLALGSPAEAAALLQRAIEIQPKNALSRFSFGCALVEIGRNDEAINHLDEALRLQPEFAQAQAKLANTLIALKRYDEAVAHMRRAVQLRPNDPLFHIDLGGILFRAGDFDDAEACCRRALELNPNCAGAWDGLGTALLARGLIADAENCYERALQIDPDSPITRANRSSIWLAQGRWKEAWPDYELRFFRDKGRCRKIDERPWTGEPLQGRTILLYADQALGDTLQSVRYVPLVAERGGRVVLACQAALAPLLRSLKGVERLLGAPERPPDFDVQAALMSLPGLFGTTPDTVPADVPYLSADPALVDRWRRKLMRMKGFKIGICWHGNPGFRPGLHRSIPLAAFGPVAGLTGVQLISLQKGTGAEQIAQVPFGDSIVDFSSEMDEASGPFMDTAAIMTQLDLVISCDTAVAHLAGALAVPVWLTLPAIAEWRWLLDRDDSPWYPTMRLFRQREAGNWPEVFARVAEALRKELPSRSRG